MYRILYRMFLNCFKHENILHIDELNDLNALCICNPICTPIPIKKALLKIGFDLCHLSWTGNFSLPNERYRYLQ